jgi:hypothetical protein
LGWRKDQPGTAGGNGPQYTQGADIVRIDGERLFAERECRIRLLADPSGLRKARIALKSQVLGVGIRRGRVFETGGLGISKVKVYCARQMRDDRVLRLQQIGAGRIELFGPQMRTAAGVDELGVDAHPVAARLDRAFENIAHAQILTDRLGVDRPAPEGHGRIARDDEAVAHARETGGQFVGQGVDEIVLPRIAREVGEGRDDDRKPRGFRGFRQAAAEHIPAAGGGQKEKRGNCGCKREGG